MAESSDPAPRTRDRPRARRSLRHPAAVSLAVLAAAYGTFVGLAAALMPLTSDKVWGQTVLLLAGRYGPVSIESSTDTFALKYPLYLLANALLGPTFGAVAFEVVVMNLVLFGSVAAAYALLVRYRAVPRSPWWLVTLVGLWTMSVCDPTGPLGNRDFQPTATLVHPNERNLEVGLALLVLVVAGLLFLGRMGRRLGGWRLLGASTALAVAAAVLCFDDPYNLYLILVPLAVAAVLHVVRARRPTEAPMPRQGLLWYFVVLTGVLYEVASSLAPHLGLHSYSPAAMGFHLIRAHSLTASARGAGRALLAVYDGSLTTRPLRAAGFLRLGLNAVLALVVALCGLAVLTSWRRSDARVRLLLPLAALVVAASFVLSGTSVVPSNARYLIALLPLFLLTLPSVLSGLAARGRGRVVFRLVCGLLVVSAVLNATHTVVASRRALARGHANSRLEAQSRTIGRYGLTKGYAGFWSADVTTYASRGRQLTIPVRCAHGKLRVYHWLIDDSWLRKPASRSYYLRTPGDSLTRRCGLRRLTRQFGPPVRVVPVSGGKRLLVYDYDIASRMPARRTTGLP